MARLKWLKISGFRGFGTETQHLDFSGDIALIQAPNSQGKTSLAEAVEFLLTGDTIRRSLVGSAIAEFQECLRNVHLPDGSNVCVVACIIDDSGDEHTVSRTLLQDYGVNDECVSKLTVDGNDAESLELAGIHLSQPPLQAPVLLQHTIRYAISARPQERTDYFKKLLEVDDLDGMSNELDLVVNDGSSGTDVNLLALGRCTAIPEFGTALKAAKGREPGEKIIILAIDALLKNEWPGVQIPADSQEKLNLLKKLLTKKQEAGIPVSSTLVGSGSPPGFSISATPQLKKFIAIDATADKEAARLAKIYLEVLTVPGVATAKHDQDCPVCETAGALTIERIEKLKQKVKESSGHADSFSKAVTEVKNIIEAASVAQQQMTRILPGSCNWSVIDKQKYKQVINDFVPTATNAYDQMIEKTDQLKTVADKFSGSLEMIVKLSNGVDLVKIDIAELESNLDMAVSSAAAFGNAKKEYLVAQKACAPLVQAEIEKRTATVGWQDLVNFADDLPTLNQALKERWARARASAELKEAVNAIDKARMAVYDEKFLAISSEIEKWWRLMRPDEPVSFGGLKRRASGKRYIDIKAQMFLATGGTCKERHAAGVFSDSQLNCLGLATFIARCVREKSGFILLDDPILTSDEEHITTFARYVIEELQKLGVQVIVVSYDEKLCKLMMDYYEQSGLELFSIVIDPDRAKGALVTKTSDGLDFMLANARPLLRNQIPEIRKLCSSKLRIAAERLCKEIALKTRRQAGDSSASILDYEGKTIGDLAKVVNPMLANAADIGKLAAIARILNPGSHDANIPTASELSVAFGDIEKFKKSYL